MSDIRVENEIEMRPINTIKPYVRNPRKNDKTVELLCKMIPKVGFNVPIVVDTKGIIIKGHARFFSAIKLGMTEVPVIVSHADDEANKVDRITDNKISEFSEWVDEELMQEIDDLDFDLSDLGFSRPDLDDVNVSGQEESLSDEEYKEQIYENASQVMSEEEMKEAEEEYENDGYYKVVCEKCGLVMYLKEEDFESVEE